MIGKQTEERTEFDNEVRRKVLMKTGFHCAACGEKLDMVKHTIDHIVPISRGGTNDVENLIGLCKMCNKYKDNLVYYPGDYYTYLMMTNVNVTGEIHRYVVEYLKDEVSKFDLHRYPLISPCSTAMTTIKGIQPKGYVRQLLFDIVYMRSDMRRAYAGKAKFLKDYAYYAIIKRTTQNLLAILRIDYAIKKRDPPTRNKDVAQLTIFSEYMSDVNVKLVGPLMQNIAQVMSIRYIELGIPLNEVCVASENSKIPESIYDRCLVDNFGAFDKPVYICLAEGTLHDRKELGHIKYFSMEIQEGTGINKYGNKK